MSSVSADIVEDPIAIVQTCGEQASACAAILASADTVVKNNALLAMADAIDAASEQLLKSNAQDLENARSKGISDALFDRLELNSERIASMSKGLRDIAAQADPVGALSASERQPSGLEMRACACRSA